MFAAAVVELIDLHDLADRGCGGRCWRKEEEGGGPLKEIAHAACPRLSPSHYIWDGRTRTAVERAPLDQRSSPSASKQLVFMAEGRCSTPFRPPSFHRSPTTSPSFSLLATKTWFAREGRKEVRLEQRGGINGGGEEVGRATVICDQVDPAYSLTRSTVRLIILPEINPIIALLLFPRAFSILASILASMHKCGLLRIRD